MCMCVCGGQNKNGQKNISLGVRGGPSAKEKNKNKNKQAKTMCHRFASFPRQSALGPFLVRVCVCVAFALCMSAMMACYDDML